MGGGGGEGGLWGVKGVCGGGEGGLWGCVKGVDGG